MSEYFDNEKLEDSRAIAAVLTGRTVIAVTAQDRDQSLEGRLALALDDGTVVVIEGRGNDKSAVGVTVNR